MKANLSMLIECWCLNICYRKLPVKSTTVELLIINSRRFVHYLLYNHREKIQFSWISQRKSTKKIHSSFSWYNCINSEILRNSSLPSLYCMTYEFASDRFWLWRTYLLTKLHIIDLRRALLIVWYSTNLNYDILTYKI